MQMFSVEHRNFCFVTTDKNVAIERICQGFVVKAIEYIRQSVEGTGKIVRVIDYGKSGKLLSY